MLLLLLLIKESLATESILVLPLDDIIARKICLFLVTHERRASVVGIRPGSIDVLVTSVGAPTEVVVVIAAATEIEAEGVIVTLGVPTQVVATDVDSESLISTTGAPIKIVAMTEIAA